MREKVQAPFQFHDNVKMYCPLWFFCFFFSFLPIDNFTSDESPRSQLVSLPNLNFSHFSLNQKEIGFVYVTLIIVTYVIITKIIIIIMIMVITTIIVIKFNNFLVKTQEMG